MGRSFFSMGFRGDPFLGNPGVPGVASNPVVLNLTYAQIEAQGFRPLLELPRRPGYVAVYPIVVKLRDNEGEFLVYGDRSVQWTDYGSGHVTAPFMIQ